MVASLRMAAIASATALLAGCGVVPPLISVASYALDGLSLVASGKSLSDHALSAAAQRDCAVWRIFSTGRICVEEVQTAAADPALLASDARDVAPARSGVAGQSPAMAFVPTPIVAPAAPGGQSRSGKPAIGKPALAAGAQHYLVLASFREPRPAEQLAVVHHGIGATVQPAAVEGKQWFRVVVGPGSLAELVPLQAKMGGVGIERPWLVSAGEAKSQNFQTLALDLRSSR